MNNKSLAIRHAGRLNAAHERNGEPPLGGECGGVEALKQREQRVQVARVACQQIGRHLLTHFQPATAGTCAQRHAFVGIAAAAVAAFIQFHEPLVLVWVALVFAIGQLLEGTLLTPNLVGDRIGLHPVAVIFAILAGGQLFGFFGVLLALPAAAAIAVWLRHLHSGLIGSAPRRARRRA